MAARVRERKQGQRAARVCGRGLRTRRDAPGPDLLGHLEALLVRHGPAAVLLAGTRTVLRAQVALERDEHHLDARAVLLDLRDPLLADCRRGSARTSAPGPKRDGGAASGGDGLLSSESRDATEKHTMTTCNGEKRKGISETTQPAAGVGRATEAHVSVGVRQRAQAVEFFLACRAGGQHRRQRATQGHRIRSSQGDAPAVSQRESSTSWPCTRTDETLRSRTPRVARATVSTARAAPDQDEGGETH